MTVVHASRNALYLVIVVILNAVAANWSLAEGAAELGLQLSLSTNVVLLRFSGELFAHSRPAISNWTGLWYPSVECRRIGL